MKFLFGVGSAAHQVEGNNVNSDWWAFEQTDGHPAEPSGDAIDHYHRFPDDIRLISQLGFSAYRFSVEWARLEPEPGHFSAAAFDHYRRMLACCTEHRLTPIVTLHHFSSPRWIAEAGGWTSMSTANAFARFCARAAEELGELMPVVCTLNEINMPELIAIDGGLSDFAEAGVSSAPFPFCDASSANEVVLHAHRLARDELKSRQPQMLVGMTLHMHDFVSRGASDDQIEELRYRAEGRFLDETAGDDFIGVQVYGNKYVGADGPVAYIEDGVKMPRDNSPDALAGATRYAATQGKRAVLITENGYTASDPAQKQRKIEAALDGVRSCQKEGVDVLGYIYWSAFDIYEWMRGFEADYGLIHVDRRTQRRVVPPLAEWLGGVAQEWTSGA